MKVKTHFAGIAGLCAALTAALALSASAAVPGLYFNADAGANWATEPDVEIGGMSVDDAELDIGYRFSAGIGYNLNQSWGIEFDTGFVWNSFKDGGDSSLSQIPFIINAVYRFPLGAKFESYIGAGAGGTYSMLTVDDGIVDDDDGDVVFAWQAIAGVRYLISETMSVGVGYKYLGASEAEYDIQGAKVEVDTVHNHSFAAVFNWKF